MLREKCTSSDMVSYLMASLDEARGDELFGLIRFVRTFDVHIARVLKGDSGPATDKKAAVDEIFIRLNTNECEKAWTPNTSKRNQMTRGLQCTKIFTRPTSASTQSWGGRVCVWVKALEKLCGRMARETENHVEKINNQHFPFSLLVPFRPSSLFYAVSPKKQRKKVENRRVEISKAHTALCFLRGSEMERVGGWGGLATGNSSWKIESILSHRLGPSARFGRRLIMNLISASVRRR